MKIIRPDRELASSIVSVHEAAVHCGVDVVTVRRWIREGCPCIRPGRRGPGGSALLDLQQVTDWRGQAPVTTGLSGDEVMNRIAEALAEVLFAHHVDIGAGIDRADAAAVLVVAFDVCARKFGKTYRFDSQPTAIQTLLSEL